MIKNFAHYLKALHFASFLMILEKFDDSIGRPGRKIFTVQIRSSSDLLSHENLQQPSRVSSVLGALALINCLSSLRRLRWKLLAASVACLRFLSWMGNIVDTVAAAAIVLFICGSSSAFQLNGRAITLRRTNSASYTAYHGTAVLTGISRKHSSGLKMSTNGLPRATGDSDRNRDEKAGITPAFKTVINSNWWYGQCTHKVVFEATETIKKMRFCGDLLAFAMRDGRVCVVRMSSGEIIDKFFDHKCEITALDFDGINIVAGGMDGSISIGRPDYSKSSSTTTSSSTSSDGSKSNEGVEIESIENIISDNEDDISVSSKSSAAMFSTSSTTSSNTSSKPKKDKAFNQANFYFSASTKNARHSKRVTGAKILKGSKPKLVSCGLDKKLICTDLETGDIKYSTVLDGVPLCMSVDVTDGYIVLGFLDGKVQFFSSRSGTKIMEIKAHNQKVESVYMESMAVLLTGGSDGVIKRWDLSGDDKKKESEIVNKVEKKNDKFDAILRDSGSNIIENKLDAKEDKMKPPSKSRFLDYYFREAILAEDIRAKATKNDAGRTVPVNGKIKRGNAPPQTATVISKLAQIPNDGYVTYTDSEEKSSVVAMQGDNEKILAAYRDGTVRMWDVLTRANNYKLRGRNQHTSSLQFDATRLVVDGTRSIIVLHDFSDTPSDGQSDEFEYIISKIDEESDIEEETPSNNGRDEDDGTPSSTT